MAAVEGAFRSPVAALPVRFVEHVDAHPSAAARRVHEAAFADIDAHMVDAPAARASLATGVPTSANWSAAVRGRAMPTASRNTQEVKPEQSKPCCGLLPPKR